jgi:hypothetical protein
MIHRFTRFFPWLLTGLIFVLILYRVPLRDVYAALRRVPFSTFLAIMLPYCIFYTAMDAFILSRVINWFHASVRFRHILPVRAAAYILSLLNAGLGQGGVAYAIHRREGIPLLEIAGSLIFLTVIEVLQLTLYAGVGIFVFQPQLRRAFVPIYLSLGIGGSLVLIGISKGADPIAALRTFVGRLYHRNSTYEAPSFLPFGGLLRTLHNAHLLHYLKALGLKSPLLATAIIVHYIALQLFDVQVPFVQVATFLPVIFLIASLPITVAHLGAPQAAWLFFFNGYGEPSAILAYSLTAHVTFMFLNGLIGICFLPLALSQRRGEG